MTKHHDLRDTRTGKYEAGGLEAFCTCGHKRGIHAGQYPHPCFNEDNGIPGATGEHCPCEHFTRDMGNPHLAVLAAAIRVGNSLTKARQCAHVSSGIAVGNKHGLCAACVKALLQHEETP